MLKEISCFIYLFVYSFIYFSGHQDILRQEGKCQLYDPVPLVLVKDIMTYMPQIKYMFASMTTSEPAPKRARVN